MFFEEVSRICVFVVIARYLLFLPAGKKYEKYVSLVVEMLLVYMFLNLILCCLGR